MDEYFQKNFERRISAPEHLWQYGVPCVLPDTGLGRSWARAVIDATQARTPVSSL